VCEAKAFGEANTCAALEAHFECAGMCVESFGSEQPALVVEGAPPEALPGRCLVSTAVDRSTCAASHPLTRRLCPCVPRDELPP